LAHELEHRRQFLDLEWFRSKCYKESLAYREQYKHVDSQYEKKDYVRIIERYCPHKSTREIKDFLDENK